MARKRRGQAPIHSDTVPTTFDLISSLLPSTSQSSTAPDEDEDDLDSEVDDILREATLLLIRLSYVQTHSILESMGQEIELLLSAPPSPPRSSPQEGEDRRGKSRESDKDMWKLDAPRSNLGPDGKGPLLDPAGKVIDLYFFQSRANHLELQYQPLRPFTILPSDASDRARLQSEVFGPGHRLPTMSIDEYLEIERERGNIITGGGYDNPSKPLFLDLICGDRIGRHRKLPPPHLSNSRWRRRWMERETAKIKQKPKG